VEFKETIGGKDYVFRVLTLRDWEDMEPEARRSMPPGRMVTGDDFISWGGTTKGIAAIVRKGTVQGDAAELLGSLSLRHLEYLSRRIHGVMDAQGDMVPFPGPSTAGPG
jgi:hypothetical protein